MARQSKRARQLAVLAEIERGSSRRAAAALAGVAYSTFYQWLEVPTFADAVTRAEAEFERQAVSRIEQAARRGSWRAQAFLLERRLPESWQQRSTLAVEGPDGELTPDERVALSLLRDYAAMTDDEKLVAYHESLRLSIFDLTAEGLLDLHAFIDDLTAQRHNGHVRPLPWERLPDNVRGRRRSTVEAI